MICVLHEKLFTSQPASPCHDLVFHHGDVCWRPTESDGSELQEQAGEFEERRVISARSLRNLVYGSWLLWQAIAHETVIQGCPE